MPFPYTFPFIFDDYLVACTEVLTLIDSITYIKGRFETITESLSLSDTITKQMFITLIESPTFIDIIRKWTYQTNTEPITLTETFTKNINLNKTELMYVYDLAYNLTIKTNTETLTLSDVFSYVKGYIMTLTETITTTDNILKQTNKSFVNTFVLSEVFVKVASLFREYSESVGLTDTVIKNMFKEYNENISLTEVINFIIYKSLIETALLRDNTIKNTIKEYSESVSLTDAVLVAFAKILEENITLTDNLLYQSWFTRTMQELMILEDIVNKNTSTTKTDTLSLVDDITVLEVLMLVLSEVLELGDEIQKQPHKILTEEITLVQLYKVQIILKTILKIMDKSNIIGTNNLPSILEQIERDAELSVDEKAAAIRVVNRLATLPKIDKEGIVDEIGRTLQATLETRESKRILETEKSGTLDDDREGIIELQESRDRIGTISLAIDPKKREG